MGNYWTNAVRHPEDMGVGHIKRVMTVGGAGDAALTAAGNGLPIGALEAGAVVLRAYVVVQTAVTGGTPVFIVGTTGDDDGYVAAAQSVPGTLGLKEGAGAFITGTASGVPLAANTVVYAKITGGATAGKVMAIVEFVNKRELEGIPAPNN